MSASFSFDATPLLAGLERFKAKSMEEMQAAMEEVAMQMLTWMNTGSPAEPIKPPIRFGTLRGSGSVFVGNKLVGVAPNEGGDPTPATAHSAPLSQITIVYNTDYAAKMHEWKGGWGKFTRQDGNAGAKWIEKHLIADAPLALKGLAAILKGRLK